MIFMNFVASVPVAVMTTCEPLLFVYVGVRTTFVTSGRVNRALK